MAKLTKKSTIEELADAAYELRGHHGGTICRALTSTSSQERLAEYNIHTVGDLLSHDGERGLYRLNGMGRSSITALQSFLFERGFTPDWPHTESMRAEPGSRLSRTLNLTDALEEANEQYAAKTGKPVGEFSKKVKENTEAQEKGARLKGRRTL